MKVRSRLALLLFAITVVGPHAQAQAPRPVAAPVVGGDDIGGVVTGASGPEAGVWVIAETADLPTKFRRIVVTDDQGRYVVPDLPKAIYDVWVRGYGLVDSPHVKAAPGRQLALTAVTAPNARAAAQYYPSDSWLALMQIPAKSEFPMTFTLPGGAPTGFGGPPPVDAGRGGGRGGSQQVTIQNQAEWISTVKGCMNCHQIGDEFTRNLGGHLNGLAPLDAWEKRLQFGQINSVGGVLRLGGREKGLGMYADWTSRIAAGEVPPAPPRPQGVERNLVVTLWDVSTPTAFVHDIVSTDKRNPRINAYGPVYGVEFHHDSVMVLDPIKHTTELVSIPTRIPKDLMRPFTGPQINTPSPYWGSQVIFQDYVNPNNATMDADGKVWMSAQVRGPQNPGFCQDSNNKWAALYPIPEGRRQISVYDPKTKTFSDHDTCPHTHHIRFGEGPNSRIVYYNGLPTGSIGWLDLNVFNKTKSDETSQGWCRGYFDLDGNGVVDPKIDRAVPMGGAYSVTPDPTDPTVVWGAVPGTPGRIIRMKTASCVTEAYEPPFNNPRAPGKIGFTPRGIDIDRNGLVWTALAGSGHLASFDRKKCTVLTGEAATLMQHCPEGWTLYPLPGPRMKGVTDEINSDFHYYNFVDQYNTFGMGPNVAMSSGTTSDALYALDPETQKAVTLRVPYPRGFFTRGLDGRIDDAGAGWKGRGLWAVNGSRAIWHTEGGKGTPSQVAHFQLRPNPLAR